MNCTMVKANKLKRGQTIVVKGKIIDLIPVGSEMFVITDHPTEPTYWFDLDKSLMIKPSE